MTTTSLFSVATIFLATAARGNIRRLKSSQPKMEMLRIVVISLGTIANIVAFTNLPLTTVYVGVFMGPMMIAAFAALFMKEPLSWQQGLAILAGFGGVVLALDPAHLNLTGGTLAGYIALPFNLVFYVANMLLVRRISRKESSESLAIWPQAGRTVLALPFCLASFMPLTGWQLLDLAGIGIIGGLGWLLMTAAFKHAPVAIVSPFHYSQIISGALAGYLIWSDTPTWNLILGAAIIIASGLYIAHHAHFLQKSRALIEEPLL